MSIASIGGGDKTPAIEHLLQHQDSSNTEVLIIPSACSLPQSYNRKVPATVQFFNELGVPSTVLHRYGETPTRTKIQHELGRATLVYTIGGNSPHMLKLLHEHGTADELMAAVVVRGVNHAGVSAGALLPFSKMHSNVSARPSQENWDFQYLNGLGMLHGVGVAHAQKHDATPLGPRLDTRLEHATATLPQDEYLGVALDDGMAVVFGEARALIPATTDAQAHIMRRTEQGVVAEAIEHTDQLVPLERYA